MINLNDIYKGKITINPKYINKMKLANPNGKSGIKGAKTWISYLEPNKNAVHYYICETINHIQKLITK